MSRGPSFVRMYPGDWRSGCLGLSLEQEGLYIRICMFIAETGRRVPLDDTTGSRALNVNINQYRKVLGQLLITGKVTRHDDGYGNHRAESELEAAKRATSKSAATPAEGASREADPGCERTDSEAPAAVAEPASTPRVTPLVTPPVTPLVEAEKTQCFLRATKEQTKEREVSNSPPASTAPVAAGGPDSGLEIGGLNGSTAEIVRGIAKLLNVYAPDEDTARRIVASNVGLYGPQAVRDGYAELVADLADNKVVVPRVKTLVGYFKTASERGERRGPQASPAYVDHRQARQEARKAEGAAFRQLITKVCNEVVQ